MPIVDGIVGASYSQLLKGKEVCLQRLQDLLDALPRYEQQSVLYSIVHLLMSGPSIQDRTHLAGAAALLSALCKDSSYRLGSLRDWLVGSAPVSIKYQPAARRAVILALSRSPGETSQRALISRLLRFAADELKTMVWKALDQWSDELYIKHSPILHQEGGPGSTHLKFMLIRFLSSDYTGLVD